jgi:hypothetical protein
MYFVIMSDIIAWQEGEGSVVVFSKILNLLVYLHLMVHIESFYCDRVSCFGSSFNNTFS